MQDMQTTISSPVGPLAVTVADDGAVTRIGFGAGDVSDDPRFQTVVTQLREYFAGERTDFDLPLRPAGGSPFEQRVWQALLDDPVRRDRQLRRDRHPHRSPRQGACRRPRQRPQPDRDRLPVPSRHRQRRLADRLRRRARQQAHAARPRGGRAEPRDGYGLSRIVSQARRRLGRWRACATSCAPRAPSASSSPRAWRGCPWARSACCSCCTPSSSPAHTRRAASHPAPTPSRSRCRTPRSRGSSTAAARRSSCASGRRSRPPRFVVLAALPDGAPLGAILAAAAVAGACQPPVGACMRALWPVLLDSPDRRHAAYSMEGALLEVVYICGPVLIVAGIGSWSTTAAMASCAGFLLAGDLAFAAHPGLARVAPARRSARAISPARCAAPACACSSPSSCCAGSRSAPSRSSCPRPSTRPATAS